MFPSTVDALNYLKKQNSRLPTVFQDLNAIVLSDELFLHIGASGSKHHCHPEGLVVHTAEVLNFAIGMLLSWELVNTPVLVTAALWHDFGKTRSYNYHGTTTKNFRAPYVHHIASSHSLFMEYSQSIPEPHRSHIEHAILAHHGRLEWHSPNEPITPEAWAIHAADLMSARMCDTWDLSWGR